jgi:hypothetical protein
MKPPFRLEFAFPRNYEAKVLGSLPPVHPVERLHHYPVELEEGDRTGAYLRFEPKRGQAWYGFFALGFESDRMIHAAYSCPDPDSVCVVVGGYAYVVKTTYPSNWFQVEQRPVVEIRALAEFNLLLFAGFTTITALGRDGLAWTSERLSWEGISITGIKGAKLHGLAWDAVTDKEVPFEVDLQTGQSTGGARPGLPSRARKT